MAEQAAPYGGPDAADPARTFEALDHLRRALDRRAGQAAQQAQAEMRQASATKTLAEAVETLAPAMSPEELAQAMDDLAEVAGQSLQDTQTLPDDLQAELNDLSKTLADGEMSPADMKRLAEAVDKLRECKLSRMKQLCDVGLIDSAALRRCMQAGEPTSLTDIVEQLSGCQAGRGAADLAGRLAESGQPGRGGITRGPGHSGMTFSDGESLDEAKFKPTVLEPGAMNPEQSKLLGLGKTAPRGNDAPVATQAGQLSAELDAGGAANKQQILPRHRRAVQRYFQQDPSPSHTEQR